MKKTILFAIAVLALASCSKQEGLTDDCSDEIRFNITMPMKVSPQESNLIQWSGRF